MALTTIKEKRNVSFAIRGTHAKLTNDRGRVSDAHICMYEPEPISMKLADVALLLVDCSGTMP